jgi:hypothetical protein
MKGNKKINLKLKKKKKQILVISDREIFIAYSKRNKKNKRSST